MFPQWSIVFQTGETKVLQCYDFLTCAISNSLNIILMPFFSCTWYEVILSSGDMWYVTPASILLVTDPRPLIMTDSMYIRQQWCNTIIHWVIMIASPQGVWSTTRPKSDCPCIMISLFQVAHPTYLIYQVPWNCATNSTIEQMITCNYSIHNNYDM